MSAEPPPQPARPQPDRTWDAYLVALDGAIAQARRAVRSTPASAGEAFDSAALDACPPPSELDPVHAERAGAVLGDLHELIRELESARGSVGRELRLHRALATGRSTDAPPLYLDGRW